jgi:spermidine synthase
MLPLTVIFVLSGAAGLIYESIWSRYLGLFVGHSAYAQVIVLVIFLGGMSVGAYLAGEISHRRQRPLRDYAYIELVAGLIGLAFHWIYVSVTGFAYDHVFPALAGGAGVPIAKWGISALMILPQSILLGATFPLMSAAAVRLFPSRPGRDLSLLYFGNSFGAAMGVLFAGFVLLRIGGLPGTLLTAAILNLIVFGAALVAEWVLQPESEPVRAEQSAPAPAERPVAAAVEDRQIRKRKRRKERSRSVQTESRPVAGRASQRDQAYIPLTLAYPSPERLGKLGPILLAVAFGTAVASFVYEIAWIRMLSLVLGSATHSFELMLSAFILGLAIGAFLIRSRVDRFRRPVFALGIIQWAMGILALATLPLYLGSFGWMAWFLDTFRNNPSGYEMYVWLRYAICMVIMLPATIFAGMTLPLITRTLMVAGAGEKAIGRVYAVNTLGAIVGVLLAALVLLPVLGLKWLLAAGALTDMAIGLFLLWPALRPRFAVRPAVVYSLVGAGTMFSVVTLATARFDKARLTSGVYRVGSLQLNAPSEILFYRDGRTATVSVRGGARRGWLSLETNGKPDASIPMVRLRGFPAGTRVPMMRDDATQLLLPIVSLAFAPRAQNVAVIGHGSGLSSHILLGSPHVRDLVTIEIEPQMLVGSRFFHPLNRRVFEDPRSTFVIDDAKSYFAAAQRQFDLIMSEPSNPWVSGTSGLFTVEFYERIKRYLAPGGVLGQWMHLYEMNDPMFFSVLAALGKVFPVYEIFVVAPGDVLIVAIDGDALPPPDWDVVHYDGVAADLENLMIPTPETFERLRIAGHTVMNPVVATERVNSDFYPVLDLMAERARFVARRAAFENLTTRWYDLPAVLEGRRLGFSDDTLTAVPEIPRAQGAAFGARLRRALGTPAGRTLDAEGASRSEFMQGLAALQRLQRLADSGDTPADWREWLIAVGTVERNLHFGTVGVNDDRFSDEMIEFAERMNAPPGAVASLRYLKAMRAWDFDTVIEIAPVLAASHIRGDPWLSVDAMREGIVTAYLRRNDPARARAWMEQLTPLGADDDAGYELRTRILRGAIERLEAGSRGAPPR